MHLFSVFYHKNLSFNSYSVSIASDMAKAIKFSEMAQKETQKIFLTDDDADDRVIFCDAVRELKIDSDLQMFSDGIALVEYLHRAKDLQNFVSLNFNMPRKQVLTVCQEIRSSKNFPICPLPPTPHLLHHETLRRAIKKARPCIFKVLICEVLHNKWHIGRNILNREAFLLGS